MIKLYNTETIIYTVSEASEMLGCSPTHVSRLCAKLGAPRFGKFFIINAELLDAMGKRNTKAGRPKAKG